MNVLFYGAGLYGKLALDKYRTKKNSEIDFKGFLDSNKSGIYMDFPILSLEKAKELDAAIVITIQDAYVVSEVFYMLQKNGLKNIYWYLHKEAYTHNEINFLQDECFDCSALGDCILPQVEMHIANHCNLNCKGCTHFSPIFERNLPDFETRIADVKKLKEKFSGILKFSILGGEPFLNPDIAMYVQEIRNILPETYIQIVTNGLLLPKIDRHILNVIKENDVVISVSEYEPTHRMIEQIRCKLNECGVDYIIRPYEIKQSFNIPLSLMGKSQYPHCCISNGCVNIWDGKIARCPTLMYIDKFNEKFETELPDNGIMQLDDCPDGFELLDRLQQEVPLCKHCIRHDIKWGQCGKQVNLADFAVNC